MFYNFQKTDTSVSNNEKTPQENPIPEGPPRFIKFNDFNRLVAKPSGNMARLKCPAEGNPKPTITWTKDDKPIIRNMGTVKNRQYAIVMEDLVTKDSGNYTCNVCNIHGCINYTIRMDVKGNLN